MELQINRLGISKLDMKVNMSFRGGETIQESYISYNYGRIGDEPSVLLYPEFTHTMQSIKTDFKIITTISCEFEVFPVEQLTTEDLYNFAVETKDKLQQIINYIYSSQFNGEIIPLKIEEQKEIEQDLAEMLSRIYVQFL
jgi:hypothetical protein